MYDYRFICDTAVKGLVFNAPNYTSSNSKIIIYYIIICVYRLNMGLVLIDSNMLRRGRKKNIIQYLQSLVIQINKLNPILFDI